MTITATVRRARKRTNIEGISTEIVFARGLTPQQREDREKARLWWHDLGRAAFRGLSAVALATATGCGAGSAEPSYQVQGAIRAYTSGGPVDVIVVRRTPAVQQ